MKRKKRRRIQLILSLITLLIIGVTMLLNSPRFQQRISVILATELENKIGTRVNLGGVHWLFPNDLIIDSLAIDDQEGDLLFSVDRIAAKIEWKPLIREKKISIRNIRIFNPTVSVYKDSPEAVANYQFLIDAFAAKEKRESSKLNLRINSFLIRHAHLKYDIRHYEDNESEESSLFKHINIEDFSTHISLKALTNDSISCILRQLNFKEQSGLQVDDLYFRLVGNHHGATLANFHLEMPHTSLRLDTIWASYSPDRFAESLIVKGKVQPSYITPQDLSSIVPEVKDVKERIHLTADFIGGLSHFNLKDLNVHTSNRDFEIQANGSSHIRGKNTDAIDINLQRVLLSHNAWNILETQLPNLYSSIPTEVTRLGKVEIKGDVSLNKAVSQIDLTAVTDAGTAKAKMQIDEEGRYTTSIKGSDINVVKILPTSPLIRTNLTLAAQGTYNHNAPDKKLPLRGNFSGEATNTELLGYTYQTIRLDGNYAPESYEGTISLDDPNGQLTIDAIYSTGEIPQYTINLDADSLNLYAMNLISIHEGSTFSTELNGDIKGIDFNHMSGKININNTTIHREGDDYTIESINIYSTDPKEIDPTNAQQQHLSIGSDFVAGSIIGDFTYQTLGESLKWHLYHHLPSLCNHKHTHHLGNNNCNLSFDIYDVEPLKEFLLLPIDIEKAITIKAFLNDNNQKIWLKTEVPQLTFSEQELRGMEITLESTPNKSIVKGGGTLENQDGIKVTANMTANADNDQLTLGASWNSSPNKLFDGQFQTKLQFAYTDDNQLSVFIDSDSSSTTINHADWKLHPFHVHIAPKHITIKDFRFEHNANEFVSIDGTVANTPSDTLQVKLNDLELNYLLSLVKLEGISFGGKLSGYINAADLYTKTPYLDGDIYAKDFTFCDGYMGDTHARTHWNQDSARLEFLADVQENSRHTAHIDGLVDIADNELWLDIDADSLNAAFLNSMLSSFMSDIKGHASGHITVGGKMNAIDLNGTLLADASMKLTPTNVTYQLKDSIRLTPGRIQFDDITAYDNRRQKAIINGAVTHKYLKDYAYSLNVDARNILGIDLPNTGDDSFYTTIRGTGNIMINGGPNQPLRVDIDARPEAGSEFALNITSQNVNSSESFITFRDRASKRNTIPNNSPLQTQRRRRTTQPTTPLQLNIRANVTQDAKLKLVMNQATDDHISAYGDGDLQININDDEIELFGTYRVARGDYHFSLQDVITKDFSLIEGSTVTFDGDPMSAQLQITARHTVNNNVPLKDLSAELNDNVRVNCLLNIGGPLSAPTLGFDIELPQGTEEQRSILRSYTSTEEQRNMQFVYLLGLGKFYTQDMTQNIEEGNGNMESFLSNTISGQISNLLASVINNDNWNFASNIRTDNLMSGTTTGTWDNMEIAGILEGRMLNNRLLINGNFGYRENALYASNFIGDFDVRYLLTNSLSAKIYNKTNDRYFTKTSLNTQGVGLLFQKDFNHLIPRRKKKESVPDSIP